MARGKHKKRSDRRREERTREQLRTANERLKQESARMAEAEAAARVVSTLVSEIDQLRSQVREATHDEELALQTDIRELLTELGRLRVEELSNTNGQNDLLADGLWGSSNTDWIEGVMREVERRLLERYPDDYEPPAEEWTILRTIPKRVAAKLDIEAIRRIEKARR